MCAAVSKQKKNFANIIVKQTPSSGLCYQSGITVYDEALINGRWIGRYWKADGFIKKEKDNNWIEENVQTPEQTLGMDMHAFGLVVDSQSLHFGWKLKKNSFKVKKKNNTCQSVVELNSTIRPVTVRVYTEVDGLGFLVRWLEVENAGKEPMAIGEIWPLSGLLTRIPRWQELMGDDHSSVFSVGYMASRYWGNEGNFIWQALPSASLRLESRMGQSGYSTPFFIIRNEATGEYTIGGLEWSGNWAIELSCEQIATENNICSQDALLGFKAGPVNPAPLRVLEPGECVNSPKMHIGMFLAELDSCIQSWHTHLRKNVLCKHPKKEVYPVAYNHWSYIDDELSEESLKFEIDVAAEIGAEMFIIDAGWYADKNKNWHRTVGDWECGNRLPNGLEPVFAYARKNKLLCGLWMDAERIGPESKIVKKHPEWLMKRYGQVTKYYDLDLTNPEAQKWLEGKIVGIIKRYKLDLFRLDYNTHVYEGGQTSRYGYLENNAWRYYDFIYSLYERIGKKFPNLILQNCAGGGGRADIGMMRRFHYTQATDKPGMPRSVRVLNGLTIALPPEVVDLVMGTAQDQNLFGDIDSKFRIGILGHIAVSGLYPSPSERNPIVVEKVKHNLDIYKTFLKPFLAECKVYHHTPVLGGSEPRGWCVLEYAARDSSRAIAGIFRLSGTKQSHYQLYPKGLAPEKYYKVKFDNKGAVIEESGAKIMQQGLSINIGHVMGSELVLFEAV